MPRLITTKKEPATMAKNTTKNADIADTGAKDQQDQQDQRDLVPPVPVKVKRLTETAKLPVYATAGAACFDLHADMPPGYPIEVKLPAGAAIELHTDLAFEVEPGWAIKGHSRSGHGFKLGVRLANCTAILDQDYRGEVLIKLKNDGPRDMVIKAGDRIAQAEIVPVFRAEFIEVAEMSKTERGEGGFGSTGG